MASGEFGPIVQSLRPIIFFVVKKLIYMVFCLGVNQWHFDAAKGDGVGQVQRASYMRQYCVWWFHIQSAICIVLAAMNSKEWLDVFQFWLVYLLSFSRRIVAFSRWRSGKYVCLDSFLDRYRQRYLYGKTKLTVVGSMNLREFRGYEICVMGLTVQIVYTAFILFYPFAMLVLGKDATVSRMVYPYEHSFHAMLILAFADFIQDRLIFTWIKKETGCSYSYFFGQPVFSWITLTLAVNISTQMWCLKEFVILGWVLKLEGIGAFKE